MIRFDSPLRNNQSYYACNWYEYFVNNNIPTIKSILLEGSTLSELVEEIDSNLIKYPFVRLCNASPKDYKKSCLFDSIDDVVLALENSNRTWHMLEELDHGIHILMRKFKQIDIEARCFICDGKLTAVSCNNYLEENEQKTVQDIILDFFDIFLDRIPYDRVTIDIGISDNFNDIYIIECNSFGVEMNAGAELFDWNEDYEALHNSKITIFKFKDLFAW